MNTETMRERLIKILGLETDPDGDVEMLLTYDSENEVESSVSFSDELNEIEKLLESEISRAVIKASTCKKVVHDNAICGCKLDCHLHDWRQKDQIKSAVAKEREEIVEKIEDLMESPNYEHLHSDRALFVNGLQKAREIITTIKNKPL